MWSRCRAAATFCQNWQSSRNRHTLYCTDGFLHWFNHYKRIFRWYSGFSISWLYGKSRNKAVLQKTTSIKTNSEEETPVAHQTAVYTRSNRRLHSFKLHITVFYSENCVCVFIPHRFQFRRMARFDWIANFPAIIFGHSMSAEFVDVRPSCIEVTRSWS